MARLEYENKEATESRQVSFRPPWVLLDTVAVARKAPEFQKENRSALKVMLRIA
jgi:hypothetical protein